MRHHVFRDHKGNFGGIVVLQGGVIYGGSTIVKEICLKDWFKHVLHLARREVLEENFY